MTEDIWQAQVVELARILGWQYLHVRRSIGKGRKWATTTNVIGWPDLLLWHPKHGFAAIELKVGRNRVTAEQVEVLRSLERAGARILVAYPSELPAVQALLTGQLEDVEAVAF